MGVTASVGALCFGTVIGWFLYYVSRHRTDKVSIGDMATLLAAVGGAAVMSLFPSGTLLFSWYAIGFAIGFFGYFLVVLALVWRSRRFTVDFFLDGRVPPLEGGETRTKQTPMQDRKAPG